MCEVKVLLSKKKKCKTFYLDEIVAKISSKRFNPHFLRKLPIKMIFRQKNDENAQNIFIIHVNDKDFVSVNVVNNVFLPNIIQMKI